MVNGEHPFCTSAVKAATGRGLTVTGRETSPTHPKLFSASKDKMNVLGSSVVFSYTWTGLGTFEFGSRSPKDQLWLNAPLTTGAIMENGAHASLWSKVMLKMASGLMLTAREVTSWQPLSANA